jgi:phage-related holin
MNTDNLKKQIKWLKIYTILNTLVLVIVLSLVLFKKEKANNDNLSSTADTLSVSYIKAERVDIVERNGKLGISLSNSTTSPNPTFDDVEIKGVSNRNTPNIISSMVKEMKSVEWHSLII